MSLYRRECQETVIFCISKIPRHQSLALYWNEPQPWYMSLNKRKKLRRFVESFSLLSALEHVISVQSVTEILVKVTTYITTHYMKQRRKCAVNHKENKESHENWIIVIVVITNIRQYNIKSEQDHLTVGRRRPMAEKDCHEWPNLFSHIVIRRS